MNPGICSLACYLFSALSSGLAASVSSSNMVSRIFTAAPRLLIADESCGGTDGDVGVAAEESEFKVGRCRL
ncbi:hypothetical protein M569_12199 [Genlisea aurea]|uniref:Secreted protein n=1 Tax=Genlisea aurea TaxID=192259 RepID=S8DIG4_9LAMI|nr:hypothetical protein M569_12199 [Genlisea aurea]